MQKTEKKSNHSSPFSSSTLNKKAFKPTNTSVLSSQQRSIGINSRNTSNNTVKKPLVSFNNTSLIVSTTFKLTKQRPFSFQQRQYNSNNNNSDMSKRFNNNGQGDSRGGNKHQRPNNRDNRDNNRNGDRNNNNRDDNNRNGDHRDNTRNGDNNFRNNNNRNNNNRGGRDSRDNNQGGFQRGQRDGREGNFSDREQFHDQDFVRLSSFNRELFLLQVPYTIPTTISTPASLPPSATSSFRDLILEKGESDIANHTDSTSSLINTSPNDASTIQSALRTYTATSPTDPVLDLALSQRAAGINKCITPHRQFHGLVKHRHEDFIVQEITPTGSIATLQPAPQSQIVTDCDLEHIASNEERTKGYKMHEALTEEAITAFKNIIKNEQVVQDFIQWYKAAADNVLQKHYAKLLLDSAKRAQWYKRKGDEEVNAALDGGNKIDKSTQNGGIVTGKTILDDFPEQDLPIPIVPHLKHLFPAQTEENKGSFSEETPAMYVGTPMDVSSYYTQKITRNDLELAQLDYRHEHMPFVFRLPAGEELDKAGRTAVHQFFKDFFPMYLLSDAKMTEPVPGATPDPKSGKVPTRGVLRCVLNTMNTRNRGDDDILNENTGRPVDSIDHRSLRELTWYPGNDTKYLHFTLEKRDYDTLNAIAGLNRNLGFQPYKASVLFNSAGIKDRRAITVQRISVLETTAIKLLHSLYDSAAVKRMITHSQGVRNGTIDASGVKKDQNDENSEQNAQNGPKSPEKSHSPLFHDAAFDVSSKVYQAQADSPIQPFIPHHYHNRSGVHGNFARALRTMHIGNFSYEKAPLKSGDLLGNHFTIVMKDIIPLSLYNKKQGILSDAKKDEGMFLGDNHPMKYDDNDTLTPLSSPASSSSGAFVLNEEDDDIPMVVKGKRDRDDEVNKTLSKDYTNWKARMGTKINFSNPKKPTDAIISLDHSYNADELDGALGEIIETVENLNQIGFLNYFGEQRFGRYWNTYTLGWLYLTGRYTRLIQTLLAPRMGERTDLRLVKQALVGDHVTFPFENTQLQDRDYNKVYREGGWDVDSALKMMSPSVRNSFPAESAVIEALSMIDPRDVKQIVSKLPDSLTLLYNHAYQSYIWNNAASARMDPSFMGLSMEELRKPVVGDVVMIKGVSSTRTGIAAFKAMMDAKDKETAENTTSTTAMKDGDDTKNIDTTENGENETSDDSKGYSFDSEVAIVTESDVKSDKYSLSDVIIPTPGLFTFFPTHKVGKLMLEAMGKDGVLLKGTRNNLDGTTNNDNSEFYVHPTDCDVDVNIMTRGGGLCGFSLPGSYRSLIKKPSSVKYSLNLATQLGQNSDIVVDSTDSAQNVVESGSKFEYNIAKSDEKYHLRVKKFDFDPSTSPNGPQTPVEETITSYPTIPDCLSAAMKAYNANNEVLMGHGDVEKKALVVNTAISLNLSFGLDPSTYATVFLREVIGSQPLTYSPQADQ